MKKSLLLFYAIITSFYYAHAQRPVISSFSPQAAAFNETVTITGSNFSNSIAGNIVYFGSAKAIIESATATELKVKVPAAATHDPIAVFNTTTKLTTYTAKPFNLTYAGKTLDAYSFFGKLELATGYDPLCMTMADLNGDGKPDLITGGALVVDNGEERMSDYKLVIYLNTSSSTDPGDAKFGPGITFATDGSTPSSVKVADLNGDGKPEILLTCYNGFKVIVYNNLYTSGSFTSTSLSSYFPLNSGSYIKTIAIADMNNDGRPDVIATASDNNLVDVFINNYTSGTLGTTSFSGRISFATGTFPEGVVAGDIDGDGKTDLVVANQRAGTISVFKNNYTTGSFTTSSLARTDFAAGTGAAFPALLDINNDGKLDIAVGHIYTSNISVYENKSVSGTINQNSLGTKVSLSAGSTMEDLAAADIDGDGKPDLVAADRSSFITVIKNNFSSGSVSSTSFNTGIRYVTRVYANPILVGDFSGDGVPEILLGNSNASVLTILTAAKPPVITKIIPAIAKAGESVVLEGANFGSSLDNNIVYIGTARAQVTAATNTSITITVPAGAGNAVIAVTNKPFKLTGYSGTPFVQTYDGGTPLFGPAVSFPVPASSQSLAVADLNNDGKPDLITTALNNASRNVTVLQNSGNASIAFSNFRNFDTLNPEFVIAGDVDGDGWNDLITANGAFFNTGYSSVLPNLANGTQVTMGTRSLASSGTGAQVSGVAFADIDGDGKPDLVSTDRTGNKVAVFRNISQDNNLLANAVNFTVGTKPVFVITGDLNGDGKPDVVTVNNTANTISVLLNTSTMGAVSFSAATSYATGTAPVSAAITDLDNDGLLDIIVLNATGNSVSIFKNNSSQNSLSLTAKQDFTVLANPTSLSIADINGDGKPDLIVSSATNTKVETLLNTSAATISFAASTSITTSAAPTFVSVADIDGDGKPDISALISSTNKIEVYRNITVHEILPVELVYFNGKKGNNGISLSWLTASESASSHFVVERSTDGKSFQEITQLAAKGFSSTPAQYQYQDAYPVNGDNYYRLKQFDMNGALTTYGPVVVNYSVSAPKDQLSVYATDEKVTGILFTESKSIVTACLYDLNGRKLAEKKNIKIQPGDNQIIFDTMLNTGIYILKVAGNDTSIAIKFQKQ